MSVLSDNYKRIISEIEGKMSNTEELEFVKEKISELSMTFMDVIEGLTENADKKIKEIEEKQEQIEKKMEEVESAVREIEEDIYMDEEEKFDFEIVCPYCSNEFVAEIDGKNEIQCPECSNIIELDWNEEDQDGGCSGNCSSCSGCSDEFDKDDEDDM